MQPGQGVKGLWTSLGITVDIFFHTGSDLRIRCPLPVEGRKFAIQSG
jgi:hypothetical protein